MAKTVKSQFWSFDMVFAIVIFSMAVAIIAVAWSSINSQLSLAYENNANLMQLQAQTLGRSIMLAGSPSNWEGTANTLNVSTWKMASIGIGTGDGAHLSSWKIAALQSMANHDYYATKQALGVSYQYYIEIYNSNVNLSIGRNPAEYGALTIDTAVSSGYLNGGQVTVKVLVWTNTTFGIA